MVSKGLLRRYTSKDWVGSIERIFPLGPLQVPWERSPVLGSGPSEGDEVVPPSSVSLSPMDGEVLQDYIEPDRPEGSVP